jgi:hypothetical protein
MSAPSYREPVRVEFADTDASGRIHHTAALRWAERAEHQLLRSLGCAELPLFPRRRLEVEFLAPLGFGDELVVEIRAIGDNCGSMLLKGATPDHEGEDRPDRWALRLRARGPPVGCDDRSSTGQRAPARRRDRDPR